MKAIKKSTISNQIDYHIETTPLQRKGHPPQKIREPLLRIRERTPERVKWPRGYSSGTGDPEQLKIEAGLKSPAPFPDTLSGIKNHKGE